MKFEKVGLDIMGLTETNKKGREILELDNGHTLIYSGVDINQKAAAGVGCLIYKSKAVHIAKWASQY